MQADFAEFSACRRVHFSTLTSVAHVYIVDVTHKFKRRLFADMFVQTAAEIVGYIIFPVRKRSRAAEARHNRAGFAVNAGFDFFAVDRALSLIERMPRFENGYIEIFVREFVRGVNSARARAHYNDVVFLCVRHISVLLKVL